MWNRRPKNRSGGSLSTLHKPVRWAVESLEQRLLLAAVSWTGAGDGVNWTNPMNWSSGAVPGPSDTVTINASANPTITIASGSQSVASITTSDPLVIASGAQLTVSSTISGSGTLTNSGTLALTNTTVSVPLVNQGTVTATGASNSITGAFTASAGSTLSLDDNGYYARVTISNSFTNDGTIALSTQSNNGYDATLTMSSGATLTNASDGTISASGSGSDRLIISGALAATAGTLSIASGQALIVSGLTLGPVTLSGTGTLNATSDTVAIAGSFTLPAGAVQLNLTNATINGPGTLTNAGTLMLNNTTVNAPLVNKGTIAATSTSNSIAGAFTASAGSTLSLDDNGYYARVTISNSFTNDGTIALSTQSNNGYDATLTMSSGATLTNASDGTISASGSGTDRLIINGALAATAGTLSIAAGQTLNVGSGTLTLGPVTLSGTGTLNATSDTVAVAGNFTLPAGAVQLNLTNATINGPGTFINAGTLALNDTTVNAPLVNKGTIAATSTSNSITGAFTASAGSTLSLDDNANYARVTISNSFTNDGTIALSTQSNNGYDATLTMSSGATLTNASDGTISASGSGTDELTINGTLTNKGTLSVQHNLALENGSFDTTSGTLTISSGETLNLYETLTLGSTVLNGTGTLNATSDTVNVASNQTLSGVQLTLASATVNGPGTLTNAAGNTLTLANTTVNAPLVNKGTIAAIGTNNGITGAFTASAGSTLNLSDNSNYAYLTISNSFTNDGTIILSTTGTQGYVVALTIASSATLTNASDGTISASGTGTDSLMINGALENQGTLSVQSVTLTVQSIANLASNTLTNGTWQVSGGGKLVLPGSITTNAANIILNGAASIVTTSDGTTNALSGLATNTSGGSLTLSGGQILGVTPAGGTFTNAGTLTIGAGSELSVTGAFDQNSGATLSVQIGGATSATFGQVVASGTATAGGALQGSFVNSYDPPAAQTFAVLNGASETGTFATVGGTTPSGRTLLAHYNATSALIAVLPLAPSAPVLSPASDTGISQTDGITEDNTPIFTGTASDPGTVQLYSDGTLVGTGTVGAGGAWSIQASTLADGHHTITAAVIDTGGDLGPISTGTPILIDTIPPTSTVAALPAKETAPFTVNWSGQDNAGGSGLATYSVYVSDNGGPYTALVLNTTSTSQTFTGQPGHTYSFYSVATDIAGNVQPTPTAAQATTAVFTLTTTALSASSPNPSNATQALSFTATVSGGVPNGEMVTLEDASNGNKVIATGTLSSGTASLSVPADTLLAGTHNLIAVYGGDADFTASQSASYAQTILPGITGISPTSGPAAGGTTVTIIGGGFTGATAVDFGSTPSTSFTVNSTGTQITAVDPAGISGATVDVTVVTPGGTSVTSAADQFTYFPAWLAAASVATWNASTNTLTVTGAAAIIADPGSAEPNIVASGSAAKLTIAPTTSDVDIHIGGINLTNGASIVMSDVDASQVASGTNAANHHSDHNVLVIGTLGAVNDPTISIDSASKLDLGDDDLIVHTGSSDKGTTDVQGNPETNELKAIEALAAEGRNVAPGGVYNGTWTGNGLTSSAAATADSGAYAGYEQNILAVEQNSDMYLGGYSSWTVGSATEKLGANDIIVKYTYNGDLNLDGAVDGNAATIFSTFYDGGATSGNTYAYGDLNGDGKIDGNDATIFSTVYGNGLAGSGLPQL